MTRERLTKSQLTTIAEEIALELIRKLRVPPESQELIAKAVAEGVLEGVRKVSKSIN